MEVCQAFAPAYGQGQLATVTTTASTVKVDPYAPNLRISNLDSAVDVFVRVTDSQRTDAGIAAVVNQDLLVRAGTTVTITKANGHGQVSIVAASNPTKGTYVQPGIGLWGN